MISIICEHETEWCRSHRHCSTCSYYKEYNNITTAKCTDPVISIRALISWLEDQKYNNIDEASDTMTEEFEKEHQWELSRNCFINKMIKKLNELE